MYIGKCPEGQMWGKPHNCGYEKGKLVAQKTGGMAKEYGSGKGAKMWSENRWEENGQNEEKNGQKFGLENR
jgi:hypothetical protein